MHTHSFNRSLAVILGAVLVSLTGCGPNEQKITRYANLVEASGFEQVKHAAEDSNSVIFYYDAIVPCDANEKLPVQLRLNTDQDEPITRIEIFGKWHRHLPNGEDVEDMTVDDLRESTNELKLNNCLSENA